MQNRQKDARKWRKSAQTGKRQKIDENQLKNFISFHLGVLTENSFKTSGYNFYLRAHRLPVFLQILNKLVYKEPFVRFRKFQFIATRRQDRSFFIFPRKAGTLFRYARNSPHFITINWKIRTASMHCRTFRSFVTLHFSDHFLHFTLLQLQLLQI